MEMSVVQIRHFHGRDATWIQAWEFLLATSKNGDAMLKATDFGLSVFIEDGVMCNHQIFVFGFVKILMNAWSYVVAISL